MFNVGDVVRLQYRPDRPPFLAVVTGIEQRPDYRYVSWSRQLVNQAPLGGWQAHAGQFGAFRTGSGVVVRHP